MIGFIRMMVGGICLPYGHAIDEPESAISQNDKSNVETPRWGVFSIGQDCRINGDRVVGAGGYANPPLLCAAQG